jgi:hypothetical protein
LENRNALYCPSAVSAVNRLLGKQFAGIQRNAVAVILFQLEEKLNNVAYAFLDGNPSARTAADVGSDCVALKKLV